MLREVREARGLTQGKLAQRAGITQSAVSQIESGVRPNPNLMTLHLLEKALGDPPVRLCYVDKLPLAHKQALERFLGTALAASLKLTSEEVEDLHHWEWFGAEEKPSEGAWHDFVGLRRRVQRETQASI